MLPVVGLGASEASFLVGNMVRRTLSEEKAKRRLSVCNLRSDILNLLKCAPKNLEDVGTVRKIRLRKISICFFSDNHPLMLCFTKHAEEKM